MSEEMTMKEFCKRLTTIYKLLKWEWYDKGIPTEKDIFNTFKKLLKDIGPNDGDQISTGGLQIIKHIYKEEKTTEYEVAFNHSVIIEQKELKKQLK